MLIIVQISLTILIPIFCPLAQLAERSSCNVKERSRVRLPYGPFCWNFVFFLPRLLILNIKNQERYNLFQGASRTILTKILTLALLIFLLWLFLCTLVFLFLDLLFHFEFFNFFFASVYFFCGQPKIVLSCQWKHIHHNQKVLKKRSNRVKIYKKKNGEKMRSANVEIFG